MLKNVKGFTLIELLAVIVILSVIALITTPLILGVIENVKLTSAEQSVNGYIDAVEKQIIINELSTENKIKDDIYSLPMTNVEVKNSKPTSGWLVIQNGEVVSYSIVMGEYIVTKGNKTVKGNKIAGPTMKPATNNDTHKGIIYLDPTDLTKVCNEENSVSTTETKTGCMKWYIFDDSEDNYTMILDHNTIARIKWNDDNKNVTYEKSNLYSALKTLNEENGWQVNPRIITAEEVNKITGKTNFNYSSTSSGYYLDTLTSTPATFTETVRSKYDWLYNNLTLCKTSTVDYGCTKEDKNTYTGYGTASDGQTWGYWTSTTVGNSGSGSQIWYVYRCGRLHYHVANHEGHGLRPVITIPKSMIS